MKTIDTRGLSCPEPVLRTRAALDTLGAGEILEVLADTVTARDNITRSAQSEGCTVESEAAGNDFKLTIKK